MTVRVIRSFTLAGPDLCYYTEPALSSAILLDPAKKPRARLNLAKTDTIAEMHSMRKPGLPTEELLTINIYDPILHSKKKWEMCCTSKEQQRVWYQAINAYNGKQGKGDKGQNTGEPESPAAGEPAQANLRHLQMSDLSNDDGLPVDTGGATPRGTPLDEVELIAKAAARASEILLEKQLLSQRPSKDGLLSDPYAVAGTLALLNGAVYLVRNGSERAYHTTWVLVNVFVLF